MSVIDTRSPIHLSQTISYDPVVNPAPPVSSSRTVYVGNTRNGAAVENWRTKIATGVNATGPFIASEVKLNNILPYKYGIAVRNDPRDWETLTGDYWLGPPILGTDALLSTAIGTAENQARVKALSALRSGFNTFTFLGELREAVQMIRRPAAALRDYIGSTQRRHHGIRAASRTPKQFRKAIAGSWLEVQFGWIPIATDIKAAFDAYKRTSEAKLSVPFKGTYRTNLNLNPAIVQTLTLWSFTASVERQVKAEISVSYQGACSLKQEVPSSKFNFGATLPDFVPAAWELLPWSFLIDYFVNIGDVIDSWATLQTVNFRYVSSTTRVICTSEYRSKDPRATQSVAILKDAQINGSASWSSKYVSRASPSSIPVPSLQRKSSLSGKKVLNIAALIAQMGRDKAHRH